MKRWLARACVVTGIVALVFWTALAVTGHHVSPVVWIAPMVAVASGVTYLRSAGSVSGDR